MDPLLNALRSTLDFDAPGRFYVAYSGGVDSTVLLHAIAAICNDRTPLVAIHVDHRLHDTSAQWAKHCTDAAMALGVRSLSFIAEDAKRAGESIETWARRCRYSIFARQLRSDDVLLTAHHQDDVVETFLLQLLRGAGPHGLSGIASHQPFAEGTLVRPLLGVSRAQILDYARSHELNWIEDPSNANTQHNRNYIRHEIMPALERRWPAAADRIVHAVSLQRQAASILDGTADEKITQACSSGIRQISTDVFSNLDPSRQRWILKRWIARANYPIPDSAHLEQMLNVLGAKRDAQPTVSWKGAQLRRYRNSLYLTQIDEQPVSGFSASWDPCFPLQLGPGKLTARQVLGRGVSATLVQEEGAILKYRLGGERCHPVGRAHSQTLKRLFQHWGIPPWERDRTPIIYIGGNIAAIAGLCVCLPFGAKPGEPGWDISWLHETEL